MSIKNMVDVYIKPDQPKIPMKRKNMYQLLIVLFFIVLASGIWWWYHWQIKVLEYAY